MMTQQYPVLRYSTYLIILIFHLSILFLLYNYSTTSKIDHLIVEQAGKNEAPLSESYKDSAQESAEALVSIQQESVPSLLPPDFKEISQPIVSESVKQIRTEPQTDIFSNDSLANNSKSIEFSEKWAVNELNTQSALVAEEKIDPVIIKDHSQNETISPQSLKRPVPVAHRTVSSTSSNALLNNGHNKSHSQTIPPAAFFQAFKDSYYQEQTFFSNAQPMRSDDRSSSNKNTETELLVNQRLGELKISDYIQQIKKAFHEAAKRTPGMYLNSGKELKTDLNVTLDIQSKGTIKIAKFQSSGIDEIDSYIKKFLLNIIVGPIPKRYKVTSLPFSTKILINIDKNTRFYTIRCFF